VDKSLRGGFAPPLETTASHLSLLYVEIETSVQAKGREPALVAPSVSRESVGFVRLHSKYLRTQNELARTGRLLPDSATRSIKEQADYQPGVPNQAFAQRRAQESSNGAFGEDAANCSQAVGRGPACTRPGTQRGQKGPGLTSAPSAMNKSRSTSRATKLRRQRRPTIAPQNRAKQNEAHSHQHQEAAHRVTPATTPGESQHASVSAIRRQGRSQCLTAKSTFDPWLPGPARGCNPPSAGAFRRARTNRCVAAQSALGPRRRRHCRPAC